MFEHLEKRFFKLWFWPISFPKKMPIIDTRDDRKINEAEVFYFSSAFLEEGDLSKICHFAHQTLKVVTKEGNS
jgi:hypothetical protein